MPQTPAPSADHIAAVRRFNRFYTQTLGVLQHAWLNSPFSLTEARVLYEIQQRNRATATDIGCDLDIDAGYMSRIVHRLQKDGLVRKAASPNDGRRSFLSITAKGRRAFKPLEQRTLRDVGDALGPLSTQNRERLVGAMDCIQSLMSAEPDLSDPVILRDPRPGDLGWVVKRHAEIYADEYGWGEEFEPLIAQIVAEFGKKGDRACERCWIAELDGRNAGSVFLVKDSAKVARLRILIVDPFARGKGVGKRLTDECIQFARAAGYKRMTLWTHEVLTAARHVYAGAGFKLTSSEAKRSFGQDVVSEHWDLEL
jgi:DNA-binding MarR family transcriptional regulator/GNAT superfamily N-acetyltransferase